MSKWLNVAYSNSYVENFLFAVRVIFDFHALNHCQKIGSAAGDGWDVAPAPPVDAAAAGIAPVGIAPAGWDSADAPTPAPTGWE